MYVCVIIFVLVVILMRMYAWVSTCMIMLVFVCVCTGRTTSWTGYFLQALEGGMASIHDPFILLHRPYPSYTMTRIQKGLWGHTDDLDNSEEFLRVLAGIECLIPRHYRDLAKQRLEKYYG